MDKVQGLDMDPYAVLEVTEEADERQLIKAFKRKALKWHPDKNPDRQEYANEMFLKIQTAFELLSDKPARLALDNLRKAKRAAALRRGKLDAKRRKLREDLEQREQRVHQSKEAEEQMAAKLLEKEIERLRKESSEILRREREIIEKEVHSKINIATPSSSNQPDVYFAANPHSTTTDEGVRVRVRWPKKKTGLDLDNDATTPAAHYDRDSLREIFSRFGAVSCVVTSAKRGGTSAIVEFVDGAGASAAVAASPISGGVTVSWLNGAVKKTEKEEAPHVATDGTDMGNLIHETSRTDASAHAASAPIGGYSSFNHSSAADATLATGQRNDASVSDRDFESVVLTKMRQMAKRKRITEEILRQDEMDNGNQHSCS